MKSALAVFLIISCLIVFVPDSWAALVINEVYPAPAGGDSEWVELFNCDTGDLNTSDFTLTDLANNKIKFTSETIKGSSYAVATSSSILNNNGDTIFLKDHLGQIIDIATYSANMTADKTFGRCPDIGGGWFILNEPTKNTTNTAACAILTPTVLPTLVPTATSITTPSPTVDEIPMPAVPTIDISPTPLKIENISLSEVMPYPQSPEHEWVEIYNNNPFSITLIDWYLDDVENAGAAPKSFTTALNSYSYQTVDINNSMFNNDGDAVRLLDADKNVVDSFEYHEKAKGKTFGRIDFQDDNFCLMEPTKNQANSSCLFPTITPPPSPTNLPTPTNPAKQLDTVNSNLPKRNTARSPLPTFSFATQTSPSGFLPAPAVMGITTKISRRPLLAKPLAETFSFCSLSYSLLTIAAVFFKIKK